MNTVLKKIATGVFLSGDRIGIHVLPSHYYSNVANCHDLRHNESQWRRPLAPMPFAWDLDRQALWMTDQVRHYAAEVPLEQIYSDCQEVGGFRYGPIEAQFLYAYLRTNAPSRVVEIGSGSSTLIMSQAVSRNVSDGRLETEIVACDPYTADRVADLPHVRARSIGGFDVDDEVLALGAGDLLFIDSSHAVRTGSELAHIYLELLPRLRPGVIVQIHDIYLPYLFAPDFYTSMMDWQETTLVAALLTGNDSLRILASMSGLHHSRPDALRAVLPQYRPRFLVAGIEDDGNDHFPSALWLRVEAGARFNGA